MIKEDLDDTEALLCHYKQLTSNHMQKKHYSKTETCSAIYQGSRTCWVTHHLYYLLAQLALSVKLTKLTGKKQTQTHLW